MTCMPAPSEVYSRRSGTPPSPAIVCLWRQMEAAVALTLAVPLGEIHAATRCRVDAAFARQVAMYMARVALRLHYREIGRLCGRDHKTVAYACRVVEQRRDDPDMDRMLRMLEDLCRDMVVEVPDMPRVRA